MSLRHLRSGLFASTLPVVLGALCAGCHAADHAKPELTAPDGEVWISPQQLTQIRREAIKSQPIEDALTLGGRVVFDDARITHVFSPVTGRVTKVLAQPGERVKKGTPLVTLASPDVGSAFSDLVKAQADVTATEHEFKRQHELFEAHAAAQRDLEASEDNFHKARAEYQRAQQKTKLLKTGLVDNVSQEYTLRSPIEGEVISRSVNPGMEVQGQYSNGNTLELFTVGEIDQVWVLAEVHELEMSQVHAGQTMTLQVLSYPALTFSGTVDWVSSTLDPTLHTARIRCRIQNPDHLLKPEMYATVSLAIRSAPQVALPKGALVRLGGQTLVFVEKGRTEDGRTRFERRPVSVDEDVTGDYYPVARGVAAGETVVVDGALLLSQVG